MRRKKIYIYLEEGENIYKLARIERNAGGLITGDYWKPLPTSISNLPEWSQVKNIHFTYPMESAYHLTLQFVNGTKLSAYKDKVVSKDVDGSKTNVTEQNFLINPLRFFIPTGKPSLEEYENDDVSFHIISLDTSVITQFMKPMSNRPTRKDDDLWVKKGGNIVIRLLGKHANILDEHFHDYKVDRTGIPYIFTGVLK